MPIDYPSSNAKGSYLLHIDDSQYSTTSTTLTTEKTIRFTQTKENSISSLNMIISGWNASSGATTTIAINIDNGTNTNVTTSSTTETPLQITNLSVPTTNGIHTINMLLSTSNASYAAYTKLWEVYAQ